MSSSCTIPPTPTEPSYRNEWLEKAEQVIRTKRGWTQTDLALRAEVDRNYVSLIELGRNSPSVRMVFRLCDALDVAPSEMLKDVERRMRLQAKG